MLEPASLFTDGAILCRKKEISVFGRADSPVRVTLKDRNGRVLAAAECPAEYGRFCALLEPQEVQTGCVLTMETDAETAEARDVAIGEVFLAGGQSNMELALCNAEEGPELIRTHRDDLLRFYNVPREAVPGPAHDRAVAETRWHRITPGEGGENSAVAYFFARKLREEQPEVPVGIIGCYWGGTSIACWMEEKVLRSCGEGNRILAAYEKACAGRTMESWQREDKAFWDAMNAWNEAVAAYQKAHPGAAWKEVEDACGKAPWNPPPGPGSPFRPAGLAETMVREAVPAALTGILYYQGENDAGVTEHYDRLMTLLIRSWRGLFRDESLPFLFVQLPLWLDRDAEDCRNWARLRLDQARVRDTVPETGMICLLDQGEYGNLHPVCKRPVGERLAELAGNMLRGKGETSPRALGLKADGERLAVSLTAPVCARDGKEPALLEIAGEDGRYVPAGAEIRDRELILRAAEISCPVQARYAWMDWSDRVNLFGVNGLPLEPFELSCQNPRKP